MRLERKREMKFFGKLLSMLGALAGLAFLVSRGIAKAYDMTFHSEELYEEAYRPNRK